MPWLRFNRIERYLARIVVAHTLVVLMVLLVILGFSEFMIQLGKVSEDYTLAKASLYTFLKLPVYGYELFPIALLIGTLIGLGGLANRSELTILRVTGWKVVRIFGAVLKGAFLLWLLVTILGEMIAPKSEAFAKKMRDEALHRTFSMSGQEGFWLKDEGKDYSRYIEVGHFVHDRLLVEVRVYEFQQGQLTKVLWAKRAEFEPVQGLSAQESQGQWVLKQVRQQKLSFQTADLKFIQKLKQPILSYEAETLEVLPLSLPLSPELLESLNVEVRYMSGIALYDYIQFLKQNGLDAAPYQLELWRKMASPLVILGMLALVFPLIFGSQRQVSMGQRIFVGILIGLGFSLLNQIFGNLSVVYQWPVVIGALLPSALLILIAIFLMRRVR